MARAEIEAYLIREIEAWLDRRERDPRVWKSPGTIGYSLSLKIEQLLESARKYSFIAGALAAGEDSELTGEVLTKAAAAHSRGETDV